MPRTDSLFKTLGHMTRNGLSVIFISHKLGEVLAFSDRIAVLRHGRKTGEMATAEADQAGIARMMVAPLETETRTETGTGARKRPPMTPGAPVLELDGISVAGPDARRSLKSVSLVVRAHEIVGIAGVSGNGQTALASLISGLAAPETGEMRLDGTPVSRFDASAFIRAGVGRIPEDRHHEGVVGTMTVAENLVMEALDTPEVARWGILRRTAICKRAEEAARTYDVRGPGPEAPARLLSGGNLQKLILARVFEPAPRLILANQPTRGLDVGAAHAVACRLAEARERGAGVVLISEDLDEILALSDRIVVIHAGGLSTAETRDRGRIGLMMAGEMAA